MYTKKDVLILENKPYKKRDVTKISSIVTAVLLTLVFTTMPSTYAQSFDLTNLEAYWKFEETSGDLLNSDISNIFPDGNSIFDDVLSKSKTGVIDNAWQWKNFVASGNVVLIDGTISDWDFTANGSQSYNFWGNLSAVGNQGNIIQTQNDITTGGGMSLIMNTVVNDFFQFKIGSGSVDEVTANGFVDTFQDGGDEKLFHMYTVTYNVTEPEVKWYKDGVLIETDPAGTAPGAGTATKLPAIGNRGAAPFVNGILESTLDEFSVWSRVLTPTEITLLYNNGNGLELDDQIQPTTCNGLTPTIVGTSGDDFLIGTTGDDVIIGLGGNDFIIGKEGDDTICGGDGDDMIFGNEGDDYIDGDAEKDLLMGNSGKDTIKGSGGADRIIGGSEDDTLKGNNGDDMLVGDSGDDSLDGGNGFDSCDGGSETDNIMDCEL